MIFAAGLWALLPPAALYAAQPKQPPVPADLVPMDLDELIQITDPTKCDFGDAFNQMGERLFIVDPATKKIKPGVIAFPQKYASAFGNPEFQDQEDGTLVLAIPTTGRLKGFPLVAIVTYANPNGKAAKTMFVLKTDYQTVLKAFDLPLVAGEKSVFSVNRIAATTDHVTLDCQNK